MDPSFLLVFPLVLILSTPCEESCLCKMEHPQTYYCNSDFVIMVNITGHGKNTKTRHALKINITEIFKGPQSLRNFTEIYTPRRWDKCAYELRHPKQSNLVIAGYLRSEQMRFTRCHMVYLWYRLTTEQRIGFKGKYQEGCNCDIRPCLLCWRGCPEPDSNECVWEQRNCDYSRWEGHNTLVSMCVPSSNGYCNWTRVPRLPNIPRTTTTIPATTTTTTITRPSSVSVI